MPPEVETRGSLGRLRLGAEPLAEQVDRYRRATWALTGVAGVIASLFMGLFGAFGRPLLGSALAMGIVGPILLAAWLEVRTLSHRAASYNEGRPVRPADPASPG